MAAALRCLVRKMARAPPSHHPRLYSGLGRSSPTPSSPPPTSIKDPTLDKENLIKLERAKAQFITTTNTCVCILMFGGSLYFTFVKPKLNELRDRVEALSRKVARLKKEEDVRQANNMQTSGGHEKDPGGHQA
ncbi:uncharacterized protein [Setaria viridis]|nr:uncharacterized protein LOC117852659 [Setaria viridis]TKW23377.1 hypothetical protein SEVIR_4G288001v2 [Setaria viridis]